MVTIHTIRVGKKASVYPKRIAAFIPLFFDYPVENSSSTVYGFPAHSLDKAVISFFP